MRFVLHYRGILRANGGIDHKHTLRKHFHCQLRRLWSQPPLSEQTDLLKPKQKGSYSLLRDIKDFTFAPLITAEMNVVAGIAITLLRPEPHGGLITQGGDIDNRLKTLFDALTIPRHSNQIPRNASPDENEIPFFCLLEDDNLITSISVTTEQLLEPIDCNSLVELIINIQTHVTRHTFDNDSFSI